MVLKQFILKLSTNFLFYFLAFLFFNLSIYSQCTGTDAGLDGDCDGDGVPNWKDVDDDNDNIWDKEEKICPESESFFVKKVKKEDFGSGTATSTYDKGGRLGYIKNLAPGILDSLDNVNARAEGSYAFTHVAGYVGNFETGKLKGEAENLGNGAKPGGGNYLDNQFTYKLKDHTGNTGGYMFAVNGGFKGQIVYRDNLKVKKGSKFKYEFFAANILRTPSETEANPPFFLDNKLRIEVHSATIDANFEWKSTKVLSTETLQPLPRDATWYNFSKEIDIPSDVEYVSFVIYNDNIGGTGNDFALDDITLTFEQRICDYDKDGIPNYLDLDSDNDGCSDAAEGVDEKFKIGDTLDPKYLVTSGGTVASGTGSSVTVNSCGSPSCVDAYGEAKTNLKYQTLNKGTSQDKRTGAITNLILLTSNNVSLGGNLEFKFTPNMVKGTGWYYKLEKKNGSNWGEVSGKTGSVTNNTEHTISISQVTNSDSGEYRVKFLSSNLCGIDYSKINVVTFSGAINTGTITQELNLCSGVPSTSDIVISGSSGTIIRWEKSEDINFASGVTPISKTGTTLLASDIGALNKTTYFRAIFGGGNTQTFSGVCKVKVDTEKVVTPIFLTSNSVCEGGDLEFKFTVDTKGSTGWFYKLEKKNGSNWGEVSGKTGSVTNNTEHTISISQVTNNDSGNYRLKVFRANNPCGIYYSKTSSVTIGSSINVGTISKNTELCSGKKAFSDIIITGSLGKIIRWEKSEDINFASGVIKITNTTPNLPASSIGKLMATTYFRALFSNKGSNCKEKYSDIHTISVLKDKIKTPVLLTTNNACEGEELEIKFTADSEGPDWKYKLQKLHIDKSTYPNVLTWNDIPGKSGKVTDNIEQTITISNVKSDFSGDYRVEFKNPSICGYGYTEIYKISIKSGKIKTTTPIILITSKDICEGDNLDFKFTVDTKGSADWSYQLEKKDGSSWNEVTGNTGLVTDKIEQTISILQTKSSDSGDYRLKIFKANNPCSISYSKTSSVKIGSSINIGSITKNLNSCLGVPPTSDIKINGSSGAIIRWEKSEDINFANGVTSISKTGTTLLGIDIGSLSKTTYFRAIFGGCKTETPSGVSTVLIKNLSLIDVDNITKDNIINLKESKDSINVTGIVKGGIVGDSLDLKVNNKNYKGLISEGGIFIVKKVLGSDLVNDTDTTLQVIYKCTTKDKKYQVDIDPPIIKIVIDDITSDNIINSSEASGNVTIKGKVTGDFNVGDTVILELNGKNITGNLDSSGNFNIDVLGSDLENDPDSKVKASVSTVDSAGNTASASAEKDYKVDVTKPSITIVIDDITSDNIINSSEASGNVTIKGKVTGDFNVGDTVILELNGKNITGNLDSSGNFNIDVLGSDLENDPDSKVKARVSTVDSAGNTASASAEKDYKVDVTKPSITIVIDDITSDNIINSSEASGNVTIKGKVTGDFNVGDTVILELNGKNITGNLDSSGNFNIDVLGSDLENDPDSKVKASVSTVDSAGNTASASAEKDYKVDVTKPSITIVIDDITSDNIINSSEASGNVTIKGKVTGDFNVGDTVILELNGKNITGNLDSSGNFNIDVLGSDLENDPDSKVKARVSTVDSAGNTASASAEKDYKVDVTKPSITIVIDDITSDNIINSSEASGNVTIKGKVTGDFNVGDTLILELNGKNITGNLDSSGNFNIDVLGSDLENDPDSKVEASLITVDTAGNTASASTEKDYKVDVIKPVIDISINDITADNIINIAESKRDIPITGVVTGEFNVGDIVKLVVNGKGYKGKVLSTKGDYSIDVPGSELVSDADKKVEASVSTVDKAGNTASASTEKDYNVDVTKPVINISINDITADNVINIAESKTNIPITGVVTGDFNIGDTVTLELNGKNITGNLDSSGNFNIDVLGSDLENDPDSKVKASVSTVDSAGNTASASAEKDYKVDVTKPSITIVIDDITSDNIINSSEASGNVIIKGKVTGDFNVGDTLILELNGKNITGNLDSSGNFNIDVLGSDLENDPDSKVEASVITVDTAGNTASASTEKDYKVDVIKPVIDISINDITADNIINIAESKRDIPITGVVTGEFNVGDIVKLVVNGKGYKGKVLSTKGDYSIDVPGSELVSDADKKVEASVSTVDKAGNTASASTEKDYNVDVTKPVINISINDITADNVINIAESKTNIPITGVVTGDFNIGDTVTLELNGKNITGNLDSSGNFNIDVLGSDLENDPDSKVKASVSTVDSAGNTASASAEKDYKVDVTKPSITIVIDDITSDNIINSSEASGNVIIKGKVTGDFNVGDTLILELNGKNITGNLDSSGNFNIDVLGSDLENDPDSKVEASVITVDTAGNTASASTEKDYKVDVIKPVIDISINDITADNIINIAESKRDIPITGVVTGEFNVGDIVKLVVNGKGYKGKVLSTKGDYSIDVPGSELVSDADKKVEASVSTVDKAGNTASASTEKDYNVDVTKPVINISINDITADNVINIAESKTNIPITGVVTGDFNIGDTVTLELNGKNITGNLDSSGNFNIDVLGSDLENDPDSKVKASVSTVDSAGNTASASAEKDYKVDVTKPSITIVIDDITSDNIINSSEASGNVIIKGKVTGDFNVGDTLILELNGKNTTGNLDSSGNFNIDVLGSDLENDPDSKVEASVITVDTAGNTASASTEKDYKVDVIKPVIDISINDITADNIINIAESKRDIPITGVVTGEFNVGDIVKLVVNGKGYKGKVLSTKGYYSIDVPGSELVSDADKKVEASVSTVDKAGNTASASTEKDYNIDVTKPVINISINDITADNVINIAESKTNIPITGVVTGDFNIGDTVTLELNGKNITGNLDSSGNFNIDVLGSDLENDSDKKVEASVSTVDPAGNTASASTEKDYNVDVTKPVINISIDDITSDNIINSSEALGNVTISGNVTGEFNEGDEVVLDLNGKKITGKLDSNGNFNIDVPGSYLENDPNTKIEGSVTTVDTAGNSATDKAEKNYDVDTIAPVINIILDDITSDNIIDELEGSGNVTISGNVTGEFNEGDEVVLDLNGKKIIGKLDSSGNFNIDVLGSDLENNPDTKVEASVKTQDKAGNKSSASTKKEYELEDTDNDGIPNYKDLDDDNDGISDIVEGDVDTDGDGIIDSVDLDSDNDGILDVDEAGRGNLDTNKDGMIDSKDKDFLNSDLQDNDPVDTDGDGVPDYKDLDSDNDGINDVVENGNTDSDFDGLVDNPNIDTDGDGIADSVDSDISNFGEGEGGKKDNIDSDYDNIPDYNDLDSDNDGVNDIIEGGNGKSDLNKDGLVDGFDSDGDGILDNVDGDVSNFGDKGDSNIIETDPTNPNEGGKGIVNNSDIDTDGDGIADSVDGDNDKFGDAVDCIHVFNEFSPDGDGINDIFTIDCIENYPNNVLEVYNRWGNLVYKKFGYDNSWRGISQGRLTIKKSSKLPIGTYFYVLDLGDGSKVKKGWLYINR